MERQDAAKLIGPSPGYVGYEEGGRLVRDVAGRPSSVVLFDEVEKAHPDVHNLLPQILEEGKLQDGTGKVCGFSQTLVIMTTNVAAAWISELPKSDIADHYEKVQHQLLEHLKREFRLEILNRIDEIVIFTPLERGHLERILDLLLAAENRRLKQSNRPSVELTVAATSLIIEKGFDLSMGARPLRRAFERLALTPLADYILERRSTDSLTANTVLIADTEDGRITIRPKNRSQV